MKALRNTLSSPQLRSEVPARELGVGERAFSMKSELEKGDDPVHCGIIGYESDHSHLAIAFRTCERINFIDLADHLCPAPGWHKKDFIINNGWMGRIISLFPQLLYVCIGVQPVTRSPYRFFA